MAHTELGFDVMKRAVVDLAGMANPDAEPKLIGRNIHVMLTPLPVNKRKPKFHVPDDETAEHDGSSDEDESEAESGSGSSSRDE
jgi:translation initiation factor IF-3